MKPTYALQTITATSVASTPIVARFQIYQQTRAGIFAAGFKTDSASEAVTAFLRQSPAFEGGDIRLWDNREQHVSAWVKWTPEKTELGVAVFGRENVFQDRLVAVLARQIQDREHIREDRQQSVRLGYDAMNATSRAILQTVFASDETLSAAERADHFNALSTAR